MKAIHRIALAAILVFSAVLSAVALDLPIKKIKGQEYFYYKVKKNESIYGISKRFGLSREEIVRHNPSAADGLKKNMMLYFPVDEYSDHVAVDSEELVVAEDTVAVPTIQPRIAVMMPFCLDTPEADGFSKMALEFYKGVLVAADSLSKRPGQKIEIYAFDTRNDISVVRGALATDESLRTAAAIIGPDDAATLEAIAAMTRENGTYVLNVLNFRDTCYLSNPSVVLANIPQQLMYETAVRGLRDEMPDFTPVIIRNATGTNEKESFVNYLAEVYRSQGVEPEIIEYNRNLLGSDLEKLPMDGGQKYVIVPSSGSLAEFNKFAHVIKNLRERQTAAQVENPEAAQIAIFGYPDWTAFRGEALDMLHKLQATIFSRFFDDFNSYGTRNIDADFRYWFGAPLTESVPSTGLLGFDAGTYMLKNLRANDGYFSPAYPSNYSGVQSTFRFERVSEQGGYVNTSLYLIHYLPSGRISARVL